MVILTSPIDDLDARLIAELRDNPRLGLLEISRRLGVARGTVQARLAKLERRGVVTGFGPEIDPAELGHSIQAFVMLALTQGRLAEAVEALEATPEVLEVDAVSGPRGPDLPSGGPRPRAPAGDRQPPAGDGRDPPLDELRRAEPADSAARAAAGGRGRRRSQQAPRFLQASAQGGA